MIALVIVGIAATALVRLQLVSAASVDQASNITRATIIADGKIGLALAELAHGQTPPGDSSGEATCPTREEPYAWEVSIAPVQQDDRDIETGLYRVHVRVSWDRGRNDVVLETIGRRRNDAFLAKP